jgi:hypothetical protein
MKTRFIVTILAIVTLASSGRSEIYLWPLHGPRNLSSSFGEYREGHFHAGVDLRTFGRVGLPCLAIQDGEVVRVRVAPGGYGKALYLRLDDGTTVVYAHVDGFARDVDSLAYDWRVARGASWCDLDLSGAGYRYSAGDTICYTGTTGTIAPHLHFEVRDRKGRPLNPLDTLYRIPDDQPPVISGLEVVPVSPGSTVNGSPAATSFRFRAVGKRNYALEDTLHLEGAFGFAVSLWDEQGFGSYRLAPLEVELFVDGAGIYRLGDAPADRYLVLFRKEGGTRGGREGSGLVASSGYGSTGCLELGEGLHRIDVSARDASGNASRAAFFCLVGKPPIIEETRTLSDASEIVVSARDPGGGTVTNRLYESIDGGDTWKSVPLEAYGRYYRGIPTPAEGQVYRLLVRNEQGLSTERYFSSSKTLQAAGKVYAELIPGLEYRGLSVRIKTDCVLVGTPSLRFGFDGETDSTVVHRIGQREYLSIVPIELIGNGECMISAEGMDHRGYPLKNVRVMRALEMKKGGQRCFPLGDTLRMCLVARSLWREGLCIVREIPSPAVPAGGLVSVGPAFSIVFRPDQVKELRMRCMPGEKVGLFRWTEGKGWKCVGVPTMEGHEVSLPGSGVYAFFHDGLPPDFRMVAVEEGPAGSGFFKPLRYYVPVEEAGCGVDPYSTSVLLNGERVVCEWDELRERLYISLPASQPAGPATLRIEIADRAGNRSVGEYSFVIQ